MIYDKIGPFFVSFFASCLSNSPLAIVENQKYLNVLNLAKEMKKWKTSEKNTSGSYIAYYTLSDNKCNIKKEKINYIKIDNIDFIEENLQDELEVYGTMISSEFNIKLNSNYAYNI